MATDRDAAGESAPRGARPVWRGSASVASVRFEPGQVLLRRFFQRGQTMSVVKCGRVVSDDERGLLLWVADGSPLRWLMLADGRSPHEVALPEWHDAPKRLERRAWQGGGILTLLPPQAAHSVWWFWRGRRGGFSGWYVNLEAPVVRWDDGAVAGVDSVDHDLDIMVAPDRSWHWKDEDELAGRTAHPAYYWVDDPDAVRAEGERVAKLIEAGGFPFDGTWCDFRADPAWTVPDELPDGWDRPRARPTC